MSCKIAGKRMSFCMLLFVFSSGYTEERTISSNDQLNTDQAVSLSIPYEQENSIQEEKAIQKQVAQNDDPSTNESENSGTDTLKHQMSSTLICKKEDSSTKIVFSRAFYIAPNPVTKSDPNCNFYINCPSKGTADLRIFDPTGNEIVFYSGSVLKYGCNNEHPFYSWNMRNRGGRAVGVGTYLAIITLRSDDGKVQTYRRKIGYKRD